MQTSSLIQINLILQVLALPERLWTQTLPGTSRVQRCCTKFQAMAQEIAKALVLP